MPVKLLREKQEKTLHVTVEELDLEAEQQQVRGGGRGGNNNAARARGAGRRGFGLTLQNLTPQIMRRLQMPSGQSGAVVTDVDPTSDSARSLRPGDVILSVNGKSVASAADAGRELQKVASGTHARASSSGAISNELFVTVKKD